MDQSRTIVEPALGQSEASQVKRSTEVARVLSDDLLQDFLRVGNGPGLELEPSPLEAHGRVFRCQLHGRGERGIRGGQVALPPAEIGPGEVGGGKFRVERLRLQIFALCCFHVAAPPGEIPQGHAEHRGVAGPGLEGAQALRAFLDLFRGDAGLRQDQERFRLRGSSVQDCQRLTPRCGYLPSRLVEASQFYARGNVGRLHFFGLGQKNEGLPRASLFVVDRSHAIERQGIPLVHADHVQIFKHSAVVLCFSK